MLYTWDWRFRFFFEPDVQEEVRQFISELTPAEAEIYHAICTFYNNHYSISMLIDALSGDPALQDEIIHHAESNVDKLIYTPDSIASQLRRRLFRKRWAPSLLQRVDRLLNLSLSGIDVSRTYWSLNAVIFGKHYETLLSSFMYVKESPLVDRGPSLHTTPDAVLQEYLPKLQNSPALVARFGPSTTRDYDVKVTRKPGFAEWWDHSISPTGRDLLVLHNNADACRENDFFYTLIHEIYPGHAHFYRSLQLTEESVFDHGALSLIEGWATFAEWQSMPSAYSEATRAGATRSLWESYNLPVYERPTAIRARKKQQGYSTAESNRAILNATQYIGYTEAYYLGALYFERVVSDPKQFLHTLANNHCGEFFALWD